MKRALVLSALACLVSGCSGSGCSGMEPIPGGFPLDRRVENGIQVRVTPDGIDFLEGNLADIVTELTGGSLLFPVPETTENIEFIGIGLAEARVCHGTECYINIQIREVNLVPTPPNELRIHMNVAAWTADASGARAPLPLDIDILFGTGHCGAWVDTEATGSPVLPVTGTVVFVVDTETGYTELEFVDLDATSGFEDSDVWIDGSSWRCDVLSWFQGFFVDSLTGALDDQLSSAIGDFTCRSCETAENCPSDATCEDGTCMRGDECVASLLGVEGRMDLQSLMATMQGEMDILVAAGGYAEALEGGLSLGFFGGAEAVTPSSCVPHDVTPPSLGPVDISPTIREATSCAVCEPPEAHLALGISETFLNRFGYGLHQSGALCLGLGGSTLPISSGMLALMMPSLRNVTWGESAPVAIELRPNQPPSFELGPRTEDEPLLAITLPDVSLDFYVWAHDRYLRFMQANLDLTVGLDLVAEGGEIQASVVGDLQPENLSIREANILDEDMETLAAAFVSLIEDMVGPMLGDLGGFALPEMSGFALSIPDGGLDYLAEGDEEFLVIYATLAMAPPAESPGAPPPFVRTDARVVELHVPPTEAFSGELGRREIPWVTLELGAEAEPGAELEFRTRVDGGFWSPWSPEREVRLQDAHFLFQGRHRVRAQARVVGRPETADPTPAEVELLIDTVAPEVEIRPVAGRIDVSAHDMVTPEHLLRLEWRRLGEEDFRPVPVGGIGIDEVDDPIEVRATDEAGNVGVGRQALRGRLPEDGSGCGCRVAGPAARGAGLLGLLVLGALLCLRRRTSSLLALLALVSGASVMACSGGRFECPPDDESCCDSDDDCENGRCCDDGHYCVEFTRERDTCEVGFHCDEIPPLDDDCEFEPCDNCVEGDEVRRGLVGLYSSVAVTPGGDVWAAGYAAGTSYNRTYGDLAVAFVEGHADRVPQSAWRVVDGVPMDEEVVANPTGWRSGIEEPGDDVGRYASIAVDSSGNPAVAYYDSTHGALMFVIGTTEMWDAPVVVDGGDGSDAGRFADLLLLPDGRPAIAYMVVDRNGDGSVATRARYIEGTTQSGASWSAPVDLHVLEPTPCSMAICSDDDDEVCDLTTNRCVVPTDDCGDPGCASGEACIAGECHEALDGAADLIEGTGIWPELAQGPGSTMGVVFYDRTNGNLMGAAYDGAAWEPSQILAGEGGDMGWAPSLFIDQGGVWHVSYVDGLAEDLRYLNTAGASEIVDGRSLGDHWSIRGDDSSIFVTPDGRVLIAYQDATELALWVAERDGTGLWTTRELGGVGLPDTATQGFYVNQAPAGSNSVVSSWYYDAPSMENGVLLFWL